jgi:hypothetical protein
MGRTRAGVTLVAAALLLAGCSTAVVPPAGITASQRREATQQDLYLRWAILTSSNPSLVAPRVAIVSYTNYLDEAQVIASCLRRSGYPMAIATASLDVIDTTLTPPESFPFSVAKYVCEAKYPEDPLELGYLSGEQEQFLYGYWQNETIPCLRAEGVTVASLPSIGQFGEGYEDVGTMNPFTHLGAANQGDTSLLQTRCPPYPGELYAASASRR